MNKPKIDSRILEIARKVDAKRAKTVIDHIIKYGFITTEELETKYGYKHPPRAARDVREQGIPLETFRVKAKDGRSIGAYRFGDPSKIRNHQLDGRKVFSKEFKAKLIQVSQSRCNLCFTKYDERYLQIDHRIPYEVAGDTETDEADVANFMLVCGTCNRKKSWSCEGCENWTDSKDADVCNTCYWANPEGYSHIAGMEEKRFELVFQKDELQRLKALELEAAAIGCPVSVLIKEKLKIK